MFESRRETNQYTISQKNISSIDFAKIVMQYKSRKKVGNETQDTAGSGEDSKRIKSIVEFAEIVVEFKDALQRGDKDVNDLLKEHNLEDLIIGGADKLNSQSKESISDLKAENIKTEIGRQSNPIMGTPLADWANVNAKDSPPDMILPDNESAENRKKLDPEALLKLKANELRNRGETGSDIDSNHSNVSREDGDVEKAQEVNDTELKEKVEKLRSLQNQHLADQQRASGEDGKPEVSLDPKPDRNKWVGKCK